MHFKVYMAGLIYANWSVLHWAISLFSWTQTCSSPIWNHNAICRISAMSVIVILWLTWLTFALDQRLHTLMELDSWTNLWKTLLNIFCISPSGRTEAVKCRWCRRREPHLEVGICSEVEIQKLIQWMLTSGPGPGDIALHGFHLLEMTEVGLDGWTKISLTMRVTEVH